MSHPDEETELIKFMRQDASVVCGNGDLLYGDNEDEHKEITNLAIFLVFVWPFGSFVLFSSLLAMCYKAMQTNTPTDLSRAAAFLHREYEVGWYWWEALELLRKIVLTGLVVLVPEERAFLRLVIATLICSCYAVGLIAGLSLTCCEWAVLQIACLPPTCCEWAVSQIACLPPTCYEWALTQTACLPYSPLPLPARSLGGLTDRLSVTYLLSMGALTDRWQSPGGLEDRCSVSVPLRSRACVAQIF